MCMEECYTKGIVVERVWDGDRDASVTVFTHRLGKVRAKVRSLQRIHSKLSGHLVPGAFADLRIVERKNGGLQIVESLSQRYAVPRDMFLFLHVIDTVVPLEEPDEKVWKLIGSVIAGEIAPLQAYKPLLDILGFGPGKAVCASCGRERGDYFLPDDVVFLCGSCFNREIKIHDNAISF